MQIKSISDFRCAVRNGPYAWPGGYPLYWLMSDGEACAFSVASTERRNMLQAIRDNCRNGWRPVALEINWEDTELYCAHTGSHIESAYGE
jgi:hypothetical protein